MKQHFMFDPTLDLDLHFEYIDISKQPPKKIPKKHLKPLEHFLTI